MDPPTSSKKTFPILPLSVPSRQRKRAGTKGRTVDPAVRAQLRAWLVAVQGDTPPRRELLIEYLHLINDRLRALPTPHLAALAEWMKLSQAEVYEVASFYHHFEVINEDVEGRVAEAPALTVRVCEGLACEMAGAQGLLARLPALLGPAVRVISAPCVGRCETAPVAVVHQRPVGAATPATVQAVVDSGEHTDRVMGHSGLVAYRGQGGYALWQACRAGERSADSVIETLEHAGLRGLGGAPCNRAVVPSCI